LSIVYFKLVSWIRELRFVVFIDIESLTGESCSPRGEFMPTCALVLLVIGLMPPTQGSSADSPKVEAGLAEVAEPVLYYEAAGRGAPVVLIHGGQLDRRMWDDQFLKFAADFRVIRYDVRGYGRSEPPTRIYSDVKDLQGLLDFLGVKRAHLVGLSLGGRIAIDFTLAHPDRVASLTAVGPGLSGFSWTSQGQDREILRAFQNRDEVRAVELWLKDPYMAPAMENPAISERIAKLAHENTRCWLINPLLGRELDPPAIGRLAEIKAPTLVIVGDRDVPDIQLIVKTIEEKVPHAKKVVVRGAGHMVNMEKPAEFNAAVLNFLKGL
jgi:pimeloyl-ACP methyl ester carboxylesterase